MAIMGEIVQAHVSIPKSWVKFLEGEDGIIGDLNNLTEEQWTVLLSFAIGYVDFDNKGIQLELLEELRGVK